MNHPALPSPTVVLCGPDGEAVGYLPKDQVHHRDTPLHLAFSSYIFDSDRRLLVTRRSSAKATWPGVTTNSCCGHPAPEEPLTDAVRRRVHEELGVKAENITLVLPAFSYRAEMPNGIVEYELCPVFTATAESTTLQADPEEVDGAEWIPWRSFATGVCDGTLEVSPWCRMQVEQLVELGPDPLRWAAGDPTQLPAAATF
ncbi:isopentenyl-diphosphate Delta-isomerase [Nocardia sp. NPDC049190]|uniref:isopentenyl-diphosphate Delta-isomerase n=1 Tax=Nocardia sp. NPDC049190 TaxID=3155650 RepID=UPI0033F1B843